MAQHVVMISTSEEDLLELERAEEEKRAQEPEASAAPSTRLRGWALIALVVGLMALLGAATLVDMAGITDDVPISYSTSAPIFAAERDAAAPISREQAIKCMLDYVDGLRAAKDGKGKTVYVFGTKDGCSSDEEISYAKLAYLNMFERGIAALETNAKIMRNCDYDMAEEDRAGRPHCIDRTDMVKSNLTCLATPDRINKLYTYVCKRAIDKYGEF